MRFVIQRVLEASVEVEGKTVGKIDRGLLALVGIEESDNEKIAEKMASKLLKMRIFEDEEGKTNLALTDVGGRLLLISQFTLYADCRKGNRPSFTDAGRPEMAEPLYEYILSLCRQEGFEPEKGIFGAEMKVSLVNDGPFTIVLDSRDLAI